MPIKPLRARSFLFGISAPRALPGGHRITAFSRYAERVSVWAQRYAPLQVPSVEFGHRSVHRFGKSLINAGFPATRFGAAPGSAGRRSCCFILAAGAKSRTDDNALCPALHEAGSYIASKENRSRDSTIYRLKNIPRRTACAKRLIDMRFVLSGAAACVLTAVRSGALRYLPLWSCSRSSALPLGAGYTLAAFGGSLREIFRPA